MGLRVPADLESGSKIWRFCKMGLRDLAFALNELVSSQLPFLADNYRLIYRDRILQSALPLEKPDFPNPGMLCGAGNATKNPLF